MDIEQQVKSLLQNIRSITAEIEIAQEDVNEYIDSFKLTLTKEQAAQYLGCGRGRIDKMLKEFYLWPINIGGKQYVTLQTARKMKDRYGMLKHVRLAPRPWL